MQAIYAMQDALKYIRDSGLAPSHYDDEQALAHFKRYWARHEAAYHDEPMKSVILLVHDGALAGSHPETLQAFNKHLAELTAQQAVMEAIKPKIHTERIAGAYIYRDSYYDDNYRYHPAQRYNVNGEWHTEVEYVWRIEHEPPQESFDSKRARMRAAFSEAHDLAKEIDKELENQPRTSADEVHQEMVSQLVHLASGVLWNVQHAIENSSHPAVMREAATLMQLVVKHPAWFTLVRRMKDVQFMDSSAREVINTLFAMFEAQPLLTDLMRQEGAFENMATRLSNEAKYSSLQKFMREWATESDKDYTLTEKEKERNAIPRTAVRNFSRKFLQKATPGQMRAEDACSSGRAWMRKNLEEGVKYDLIELYDIDKHFSHVDFVLPKTIVGYEIETEEKPDGCPNCDRPDCDEDCTYCDNCEEYYGDDGCPNCSYCEICDTTYSNDESCGCTFCDHCEYRNGDYADKARRNGEDYCECVMCDYCEENRDAGDCACTICDHCSENRDAEECTCELCPFCDENMTANECECEIVEVTLPMNSHCLPDCSKLHELYDGGVLITTDRIEVPYINPYSKTVMMHTEWIPLPVPTEHAISVTA